MFVRAFVSAFSGNSSAEWILEHRAIARSVDGSADAGDTWNHDLIVLGAYPIERLTTTDKRRFTAAS